MIALCCLFLTLQAQQTQRMFFVGNSVTDAMNYQGLKSIVQSRGNVDTWSRLMIPGAPLSYLWDARTTGGFTEQPYGNPDNAFTVYSWDILSLQPFDRGIEGVDGDRIMCANFYNLIKSKSPDCEVFIYAHWPRTPGNISELVATQQQYNDAWLSQTGVETRKYYEDLTAVLRTDYPATAAKIRMVPIGEVMYQLNNNAAFLAAAGITSIWGVYSDGIHMKGFGSYIASCVMYAMAYHDDPAGLGVPGDFGTIPAAALPYIHQAVKDVIIAKSTLTGITYFGAAPVLSVALNASAIELNTTKTATLTPIFTPSNAANKAVSWGSSNDAVASVLNGVVTANAVGTANITVTTTDGGKQAVCAVTVVNNGTAVTGIALNKSTTNIVVAATETLTATISPAGATNKNVLWSSSDPSIATVSATGLVTGVKKGVATISVSSVNGLFTAPCVVTVTQVNHPPVAVMKFSPGNAGYAPYKVSFDGRSSSDPDPGDFVLGYDWVVKLQGAATNLATEVSNGFDYTFTTPGVYEVTLQAVDNAEQLRSLNTEKVVITVLAMPAVPAAETALCYEGFDYVKSAITDLNGGRGWKQGWVVQDPTSNTVDEFAVDNTTPITVTNLRASGNYMKLGQGYSGCGRPLDISAAGAFKNYLNASGNIGKAGTTLWFSTIIRPQSNNKSCSVSFSNSGIGWYTNNGDQKVDFGCFGGAYWGFAFGWDVARTYNMSTIPVVNNTPAFLVAKVDFGATNTVTLYVNPAPGNAPTGTPVIGTTTSNIEFKTLGMTFGVGSNQMGLDEIRFGTSYADVAPMNIPDTAPPTTPTGLTVGAITSASVVLNWNASVNAVGTTTYDVYQGGVLVAGSNTTNTTYTVTGLTPSTLYSFTVIAKDGFGSAVATDPVTATTSAPVVDAAAPTTPTGLAVGTITSSSVVLNWNASVNVVGTTTYDVYKGGVLVAGSNTTNTTYTVNGLAASTLYSFTVIAKDGFGSAVATDPVTATTSATVVPVVGAPNLYEGFNYPLGATDFSYDAANWKGAWASVGGSGATFGGANNGIATASPLVVSGLLQTGNYYLGTAAWVSTVLREVNRDWNSPYADYLTASSKQLGLAGKTLWLSIILRPQTTSKTAYLGGGIGLDATCLFSIGAFGGTYWGLKIGTIEYPSTVPIVVNEAVFLVCKIDFAATTTVTLYVNPTPGAAPTGTPIVQTTTSDLSFVYIKLGTSGGGTGGGMSADELHVATTYALVAPSTGGNTGITKNSVENVHVYSNNGQIVADLSALNSASTVTVFDIKGSAIKSIQSAGAELLHINVDNKGVYMVRIQNGAKVSTVKVVL